MRVLIVDDSVVYRSKISAALSGYPGLEVVGVASNGKIALEMISQKSVDLVTLDMEMPVMDGLQTLRELRRTNRNTKVIVFSSSTVRGSEATLDALGSGADDFVTKPVAGPEMTTTPEEMIRNELIPKIQQFITAPAKESLKGNSNEASKSLAGSSHIRKDLDLFTPSALVIASSTGGPAALEAIFAGIGGDLRCPIFVVQHMPPVFTATFSKRLGDYSGLPCIEAVDRDVCQNKIYVAPGDFHLTLKKENGKIVTQLGKQTPRNSVRPAADYLFESAADIYGSSCMSFVLTGMGQDGLAGVQAIKKKGGGVMIQSELSCVVFGMPGAVFAANLQDEIGPLDEIRKVIQRMALR